MAAGRVDGDETLDERLGHSTCHAIILETGVRRFTQEIHQVESVLSQCKFTCVRSVLVYSSETWAMSVEDMNRLERAERIMVRLWAYFRP